jgi:hypothetical protein
MLDYPGKWTNGLAYFGRRVCDEKKKFCKTAAKAKQLTHLTRSFLHETPPWEKTKKKKKFLTKKKFRFFFLLSLSIPANG